MRLTPDSRAPAKADPWKVCVGCNPCPCSGVVVVVVVVVVCCCCVVVVVAVVVRRMQTGNLLPEMRQHILQEFCVDGMDLLLGLGTSIEHRKISNLRLVVFYACRVW